MRVNSPPPPSSHNTMAAIMNVQWITTELQVLPLIRNYTRRAVRRGVASLRTSSHQRHVIFTDSWGFLVNNSSCRLCFCVEYDARFRQLYQPESWCFRERHCLRIYWKNTLLSLQNTLQVSVHNLVQRFWNWHFRGVMENNTSSHQYANVNLSSSALDFGR